MKQQNPTVCVIGLGYIGLPTASLLANCGFQVTGVDVNPHVVETIASGHIHIEEPDLDMMVRAAVAGGHLKASLTPVPADVFVIAVPTPFKDGYQPDLTFTDAAVESVIPHLKNGDLVILESTIPVGTTDAARDLIRKRRTDLKDVRVAHCPERVLPGQILKELVTNDRIVGGVDSRSAESAQKFYSSFVKGEVLITDARTAELCKLTENSFRDVNIAFANELSMICRKLGIDVWRLIELANHHPRVKILQPGPGVGGHCIAVDPWFIVASVPDQATLIRTAREVNLKKTEAVVDEIISHVKPGTSVACFGLAFKANVGDLRESPAVEIVEHLASNGVHRINVVEPFVTELPKELAHHKNVHLTDAETAIRESRVLALLVDHKQFQSLSYESRRDKIVIDTRGAWRERRGSLTRAA